MTVPLRVPAITATATSIILFFAAAMMMPSVHSLSTTTTNRRGIWGGTTGIQVTPLGGGNPLKLDEYLRGDNSNNSRSLFIFGTYAADFNAIEYLQRLRYYLPILRDECGVTKFGLVLNCQPHAARALADAVDLNTDEVDIFVDNGGRVGREWGVQRGWLPDDEDVNPFLKLFGMLWGLGAWATLPAVIGGYIGNPFVPQPWIEDALAVGQRKGRWPDNALDMTDDGGDVVVNKFSELPVVGGWERRPLELATLRLQSMIGISLKRWDELSPDEEALDAGVLTQLGGCIVVDGVTGDTLYEWRDPGICAVANFEDVIKALK